MRGVFPDRHQYSCIGSLFLVRDLSLGAGILTSWPDFREVDWNDLYPRLLAVARGRMGRLRWRGGRSPTAPMAAQAEDFVQTAIRKAMDGLRSYDPTKSLFINLCQIISSD